MLSPIHIRDAGPQDLDALRGLGVLVFLHTYAQEGLRGDLAREAFSLFSPEAVRDRLAHVHSHLILAERHGHVVGFARLTLERASPVRIPGEASSAQAELSRLYVHPHAHGQGVGTRLIQEVESRGADAGVDVVWLTVWSGNQQAQAFYQRQGYSDEGAAMYTFEGETYENRVYAKWVSRTPLL